MRVVTMSWSYGSGGSVLAPMLAERLGVPFLEPVRTERNDDETVSDLVNEGPSARVAAEINDAGGAAIAVKTAPLPGTPTSMITSKALTRSVATKSRCSSSRT